jgi:3-oxoacyl-[acyl-carrier protein] reductase
MTASVPDTAREMRARAGIQGGGQTPAPAATAPAPDPAARADFQRERMRSTLTNMAATAGPSQGDPEDIAPMVCFLASDYAWNINGQIFAVNGGNVSVLNHPLAHRTIYKQGMWALDELDDMVPRMLLGMSNPAPPASDLEVPGRPAGG